MKTNLLKESRFRGPRFKVPQFRVPQFSVLRFTVLQFTVSWLVGGGLRLLAFAVGATLIPACYQKYEAEVLVQDPHLRLPIQPAEVCATCHPTHYEEWKSSLMAYMAVSPFFNGLEISVQELIGRNNASCPKGAGALRRANADDQNENCTVQDVPIPGHEGLATDLNITGAGGEHWCVNCHLPSENTFRTYTPPGETEPLVTGMPNWSKKDASSRRPVWEILKSQGDPATRDHFGLTAEARTMLQGTTCDACHRFVKPVETTEDALEGGTLDRYLDPDTYLGNPYWTSFSFVEDGNGDAELCFDQISQNENTSAVGEPCKYLFREEGFDGPGIGNSGYYIDVTAVPAGADKATAGSWRFGPKLDSDDRGDAGVPPLTSSFHNASHAAVDLKGDPVRDAIFQSGIDDDRYVLPDDGDKSDYFQTSNVCGTCHDVRIIGTDTRKHRNCAGDNPAADCFQDPVDGVQVEPYKRLRDGYTEWRKSDYAKIREEGALQSIAENRSGESVVTCQDCHMSTYPIVFAKDGAEPLANCAGEIASVDELDDLGLSALKEKIEQILGFNPGFSARLPLPGCFPFNQAAVDDGNRGTPPVRRVSPHYFTGADVPLDPLLFNEQFADDIVRDLTIDSQGLVKGLLHRRDLLMARSVSMQMPEDAIGLTDDEDSDGLPTLELQLLIENIGAGHRVPAAFSQEREMWVELVVTDESLVPSDLNFECGKTSMLDIVYGGDSNTNYAAISECISKAQWGESLDTFCANIVGDGQSLQSAISERRSDLGILVHMGALIDQDHRELVIGTGPNAEEGICPVPESGGTDRFCDTLDYESVRALFDNDGVLIDTERARATQGPIMLLEFDSDGYFVPGEKPTSGEWRIVERADGNAFDEEIPDKAFVRIRVNDDYFDNATQNLIATYGMDVVDGPYPTVQLFDRVAGVPQKNDVGEFEIRSEGLINFQNGFIRCVACCASGTRFDTSLGCVDLDDSSIVSEPPLARDSETGELVCCRGEIVEGLCVEDPTLPRAFNLLDGAIELEGGVCTSNLVDDLGVDLIDSTTQRPAKFFETFSPIGGLTADAGIFKAADGIINERSLPPGEPYRFFHKVELTQAPANTSGNLCVEARLNFRAFPPYLLRAFAARELLRLANGEREEPTVSFNTIDKLDRVVMAKETVQIDKNTVKRYLNQRGGKKPRGQQVPTVVKPKTSANLQKGTR